MPDAQPVASCGDRVQAGAAVGAGQAVERRVDDGDPRGHLVMDVAAHDRDAGLVEHDRHVRDSGIELQFEGLGRGERVDMVAHGVEIGEHHRGADRQH
eukprot:gene1076-1511_t